MDSANPYSYAAGDPINRIDPSGLSTEKGGAGGTSDSATAAAPQQPAGSGKRSLFYGNGGGPGIHGPEWLMDVTDALRKASNDVRDVIRDVVDATLGKLGVVGQFLGGIVKRGFDYALMTQPIGFAVHEEESAGAASMLVMAADAVYSPDRERAARLGQMVGALPEAFAHMSAGEWGSLTADVIVGLFSGEAGAAEAVERMGLRAGLKAMGRGLKRIGGSWSKAFAKADLEALADAGQVAYRLGKPVAEIPRYDWAMMSYEERIAAVVEKYGINLRGKSVVFDAKLGTGQLGMTSSANPTVMRIGSGVMNSETELAATVAHELRHSRAYLGSGLNTEAAAEASENALRELILGKR